MVFVHKICNSALNENNEQINRVMFDPSIICCAEIGISTLQLLFSSPCQRQCELLPSLGVRPFSSVVR